MEPDRLHPWEAMMKRMVWQKRMLEMENRVSDIPEYKAIAFFHHY